MTSAAIVLGILAAAFVYALWTGRRLQKGRDAEGKADAASDANRIREDVRRLDDDALDDELRKYARPLRKPGGDQP